MKAAVGRLAALGLAVAVLAGCLSAPAPRSVSPAPAPAAAVPLMPEPAVPESIPKPEPHSRHGNPPFYDVLGRRYYVLSSSADYVERGVASWYGPGFHRERTSTGELYDMYGMTAAHKTLPLPAYVQVTNLKNGRSIVVRVNDRGPFVGNRLIDLSYTAASRLDMLRSGTAMVEVRSVGAPAIATAADSPAPAVVTGPDAAVAEATLFVQAGAFADPANAERLVAKLKVGGYGNVFIRDDLIAGRKMYRVRIGPVADVAEFDRIVTGLENAGVHDAHLASD